jgi:hypothetical protein
MLMGAIAAGSRIIPRLNYFTDATMFASGKFIVASLWLPGDQVNVARINLADDARQRPQGFSARPFCG